MNSKNIDSGFDLPDDDEPSSSVKDVNESLKTCRCANSFETFLSLHVSERIRTFEESQNLLSGTMHVGCSEFDSYGLFRFFFHGYGSQKQVLYIHKRRELFMTLNCDQVRQIMQGDYSMKDGLPGPQKVLLSNVIQIVNLYDQISSDDWDPAKNTLYFRVPIDHYDPLDFIMACFGSMKIDVQRQVPLFQNIQLGDRYIEDEMKKKKKKSKDTL